MRPQVPRSIAVVEPVSVIIFSGGIIAGKIQNEGDYVINLIAENALGRDEKTLILEIYKDKVQLTPLLGFTTWNAFGYQVTQKQVEDAAKNDVSKKPRHQQLYAAAQESEELEEIFIRTYGKVERKTDAGPRKFTAGSNSHSSSKPKVPLKEYLLVDGYNVIHAWDDLKELARDNFEAARNKLMDILCNYQGYKKCTLILVFDAYKVEGFTMEVQKYHNIHVVYTKEAETADQYIEKVVHEIGRKYHVTVVTSDGIEQIVTLGQGGTLISAREFRQEVEIVRKQIQEEIEERKESSKNYLFNHLDEELAGKMEEIRLGKNKIES